MLTVRHFGAIFFLLYGLFIPVLAPLFVAENLVASLAMIAICIVISLLLYSGRALLINILLSFYVFRAYLTRPYVDIFIDKLDPVQLKYILTNNKYFNADDATVVYISLLSLLIAWFLGLMITKSKNEIKPVYWIFRQIDNIVFSLNWRLWLVLIVIAISTYRDPTDLWQSALGEESTPLAFYGLLSLTSIIFVFLAAFIFSRQNRQKFSGKVYYLLLLPVSIDALLSVSGGGRSALYGVFIFALLYWIFLNSNRYITFTDIKRLSLFSLFMPFVILGGLIAQVLRPLLRGGMDTGVIWDKLLLNLNVFNPDNPLLNIMYFGLTELMYRLSSLHAQFLILNDRYINPPGDTFNLLHTFQRTINDILPGTLFPDPIAINRLFHHIYSDVFVNYSSHMWSIQGTFYLYFGFILSPLVVFLLAIITARNYSKLHYWTKASPASAVFFIFLFNAILENGTIERILPVDVVRPLVSFIIILLLVKILYILFPSKTSKDNKLASF